MASFYMCSQALNWEDFLTMPPWDIIVNIYVQIQMFGIYHWLKHIFSISEKCLVVLSTFSASDLL